MKRLCFIDPIGTRPYDHGSMRLHGLGGTEATVARVASSLTRWFAVTVAQACRDLPLRVGDVDYVPFALQNPSHHVLDADAIVVVRSHKILPRVRKQNPHAALYLWMHCMPGRKRKLLPCVCVDNDVTVVTVSRWHCNSVRRFAWDRCPEVAEDVRIEIVHNPIEDDLRPRAPDRYDPDKLLFVSSPHKGLDRVLECFAHARREMPTLRLDVANPGYLNWRVRGASQRGVRALGTLPHHRVIEHMRNALCLFYPQHTFEETFGLVLAEANAVGTPALAHPLGATPEILSGGDQLVDATDTDAVVQKLVRWRSLGRPKVSLHRAFRRSEVVLRWAQLLGRTEAEATGT